MRLAFTLTTAWYVVLLGVAAVLLPERVPVHFGVATHPESWGSRTDGVLVLGASGLFLAVALAWGARAVTTRSLSSPWLNLPHREWWIATPAREAEARRRLRVDLHGLGAATMLLMSLVLVSVVVTARAEEPTLGTPFVTVIVLAVVGLLVWSLYMSLFRYRPQEGR